MAIKIFIDQGHNPVNPNAGAEGNGLREQDITYDIGQRLAAKLRANDNFEVMVSRTDPEQVLGISNATSLRMRVDAANRFGADAFLSLHTNAASSASATGAEALVFSLNSRAASLADDLLTGLVAETGLRNRGIHPRPGLYVLRKTAMPAVLVEMGFITNPSDAAILSQRADDVAQGLYLGLLSYFGVS